VLVPNHREMTILVGSESSIDSGNVDIVTLLEKEVGAETQNSRSEKSKMLHTV